MVVIGSRPASSRKLAKEEANTRYFGKACVVHPDLLGERITSSGCCVQCARIKRAAYNKGNGYAVAKRSKAKLIAEVFGHYGNRCLICAEDDRDKLTIDHINQQGSKHTNPAGLRYQGPRLYRWLKKNNYPDGFRCLCFNCNVKAYRVFMRRDDACDL